MHKRCDSHLRSSFENPSLSGKNCFQHIFQQPVFIIPTMVYRYQLAPSHSHTRNLQAAKKPTLSQRPQNTYEKIQLDHSCGRYESTLYGIVILQLMPRICYSFTSATRLRGSYPKLPNSLPYLSYQKTRWLKYRFSKSASTGTCHQYERLIFRP